MASTADERATRESIPDLGRQFIEDSVRLVRLEIELAKAQARETAIRIAVAAAVLVTAVLIASLGMIYAIGSAAAYVGPKWLGGAWAGWAVLGGFLVLVSAIVGLVGYRRLTRTIRATQATLTSMKEDVEWVKQLTRRDARST